MTTEKMKNEEEKLLKKEVYAEFEEIRSEGQYNMFDVRCVRKIAEQAGLENLVKAIDEGHYPIILTTYDNALEQGLFERK